MASGWNLWVWLVGVVVRRYIDFLIIITFPYSTCISSVLVAASLDSLLGVDKLCFFIYLYYSILLFSIF